MTDREVTLKLNLRRDPTSAQILFDLAHATEGLAEAEGRYQQRVGETERALRKRQAAFETPTYRLQGEPESSPVSSRRNLSSLGTYRLADASAPASTAEMGPTYPEMRQAKLGRERQAKEDEKREEADYQKMLQGRIAAYHLALRLKEDLAKAGIGAELTEEEKYQKLLQGRIDAHKQDKRLKEDLVRLGLAKGESTYEERVSEAVQRQKEAKQFAADVQKATPGETQKEYQQRVQDAVRRQQEAKRFEADVRAAMPKQGITAQLGELVGNRLGLGGLMGGGSLGAVGAAGLGVGAVVGSMALLGKAAGTTARVLDVLGSSAKTNAQKFDTLAAEFIPGAAGLIALRDAIKGVTDKIYKLSVAYEKRELATQQGLELNLVRQRQQAEVGAAKERAGALATYAAGITAPPKVDRSTVQGELEYERQQRLLPLQDAQKRAQVEADIARKNQQDSAARVSALQKEIEQRRLGLAQARKDQAATVQRENAQVKKKETPWWAFALSPALASVNHIFNNGRDKPARQEAGQEVLAQSNALAAKQAELQAEIARQRELGLKAEQAQSAVRKAGIEIQKEELSLLKEKEKRQVSMAQQIGGMSRPQAMMAAQAARAVLDRGIDNVAPQMLDLARQIIPGYIAKATAERARAGEGPYADVRAIREQAKEEGLDYEKTREAIAKVQTEVRVNIALDEAQLATKIVEVLERSFKDLIKSIEAKHVSEKAKQEAGQQIRNNQ